MARPAAPKVVPKDRRRRRGSCPDQPRGITGVWGVCWRPLDEPDRFSRFDRFVDAPTRLANAWRWLGGAHNVERMSLHCRDILSTKSRRLRWSPPVVNGLAAGYTSAPGGFGARPSPPGVRQAPVTVAWHTVGRGLNRRWTTVLLARHPVVGLAGRIEQGSEGRSGLWWHGRQPLGQGQNLGVDRLGFGAGGRNLFPPGFPLRSGQKS